MEVIIQPNQEAAASLVARIVAHDLRANSHLVLGLATGTTMERVYRQLVHMHQIEKLDFSLCSTFNLDEYVGLFPSDPNSYRHYMDQHLFRHVNVDPRNTHLPNGLATDLDAECRHYEAMIVRFGGIDLQLLGIGKAGHIGFNEPTSSLASRTRIKTLTPQTRKDNARFFGSAEKVPHHVITMGLGTIMEARQCLMLAFGANKARAIAATVEGPMTANVPASILQMHPSVKVFLDKGAAARLKRATYYHWVFKNKPDWQTF